MDSLKGATLYSCKIYTPNTIMANVNPTYFNATDADDKPIKDGLAAYQFDTGDKIVIRAARTDMKNVPPSPQQQPGGPPIVIITLDIENKTNAVWASVNIDVQRSKVVPGALLRELGNGFFYSLMPVADNLYPKIGMTRSEVYCRIGVPEHTNHDELGGDQMIYHGGKLLVYVSPRTDRVTNVQSSD